jgi:1,4-dihydroxy-2-naphthoate octaprenyltransferase
MGSLMVVPSYYIQSGILSWQPFWASLSISSMTSAFMHANDVRDIDHDRNAGITTPAMRLGYDNALRAYFAMTVGAYIILVVTLLFEIVPVWGALPFIILPILLKKIKEILSGNYDLVGLEDWTAKFHLQFGTCLISGIILATILK